MPPSLLHTVTLASEEGEGVENAVNWTVVGVWAATAAGGLLLLTLFARYGGLRQTGGAGRISIARILTHFALAVIGLALWIVYAITDRDWSAWSALGFLTVAIGIGGSMLLSKDRWRAERMRASGSPVPSGGGAEVVPAEQRYPMWLHAGHGALAITTLVLVLLNRSGAFG